MQGRRGVLCSSAGISSQQGCSKPRQQRCHPRGCPLPTRELLCGERRWEEGKNREKKGEKAARKSPEDSLGEAKAAWAASAPGMEQEARCSWGSLPAGIFPALPSSSSARIAPQDVPVPFVPAPGWHKPWDRARGGSRLGGAPGSGHPFTPPLHLRP